jgi:hypothetical protein
MAAPKVFVSHSHKDDAFTAHLVADLRGVGAEVWVDVSSIDHGDFMQRIDEALRACEWTVVVLTPNAVTSDYVQMEVNASLHRVRQGYMQAVIPVLASACPTNSIPALWDVLHRYDATQDYGCCPRWSGARSGALICAQWYRNIGYSYSCIFKDCHDSG